MKKILYKIPLVLLIGLTGCYHLGSSTQVSFKKLYVEPVENNTYIAQAQGLISSQLREQLLKDGSFDLTSKEEADAILKVTLLKYTHSMSATQEKETGLARSLSFSLTGEISLYDKATQKYLINKQIVNSTIITLIDGGAQMAEYQSIPSLTESFAQKIKIIVTHPW